MGRPRKVQPETPLEETQIKVRPVFGRMHHLLLDIPIPFNSVTTFDVVDSWLQAQVDAGKLEIV